jgi:hypothetical protein
MSQADSKIIVRLQHTHAASYGPSQSTSIKDHNKVYYVLCKQHRRYCGVRQPMRPNLYELKNKNSNFKSVLH